MIFLIAEDGLKLNSVSERGFRSLRELSEEYRSIKYIAILPDFHFKPGMEIPSSVTFAVKDHICLSLSSPEQNCGMTLVLTPLFAGEVCLKDIEKFFTEIRSNVPLPPRKSPVVDRKEVMQVLREGARWVCRRFEIDLSLLEAIENGGNVFNEDDLSNLSIKRVVPEELFHIARYFFCHVGDGNHFLEMQYIDKIINLELCTALGIQKGQITIMFHSGSGYFGSLLGRYYSHRTKNTLEAHLKLFPKKVRFHLSSASRNTSVVKRIKNYLLWKKFVFLPTESTEGKRAILAIKASTNYGYANRLCVFYEVRKALEKVFGIKRNSLSIYWDYSHNSIQLENFLGKDFWFHRHNTCRLFSKAKFPESSIYRKTGQPIFIPGSNLTASYIGVAGDDIEKSLNSVDHGAGRSIQDCIKRGVSKRYQDRKTLYFSYRRRIPNLINQFSDEGLVSIINTLDEKKIVKPIARLRPIATLKG